MEFDSVLRGCNVVCEWWIGLFRHCEKNAHQTNDNDNNDDNNNSNNNNNKLSKTVRGTLSNSRCSDLTNLVPRVILRHHYVSEMSQGTRLGFDSRA